MGKKNKKLYELFSESNIYEILYYFEKKIVTVGTFRMQRGHKNRKKDSWMVKKERKISRKMGIRSVAGYQRQTNNLKGKAQNIKRNY